MVRWLVISVFLAVAISPPVGWVSRHPLMIFVAVLAGGQPLGILEELPAIPVTEILRILAAEWLAGRARETGGIPHGTDDPAPIEQVAADTAGPRATLAKGVTNTTVGRLTRGPGRIDAPSHLPDKWQPWAGAAALPLGLVARLTGQRWRVVVPPQSRSAGGPIDPPGRGPPGRRLAPLRGRAGGR